MIRVPAEYGGGGGEEEPGPDHPRLQAGQPRGQPGQGDHLVRYIPARLVPGFPCNLAGYHSIPYRKARLMTEYTSTYFNT
jgi:hypothetical protein